MARGDVQDALDAIPGLVKNKDAAALVELAEHPDKRVRKAAGKGLHALKSKGVPIPERRAKSWTPGDALRSLRGNLEPAAMVETDTVPGLTRFMLSLPEPEEGARLFVATLGPDDRVLAFNAYWQTDGQRARLVRDWQRRAGDRTLPVDWVQARIRWARERTIAEGLSIPRALDDALRYMGEEPKARPDSFLPPHLEGAEPFDADEIDEVIATLNIPMWPPMVNLDAVLANAERIHGDKPQPTSDDERVALLTEAVAGDEEARKGLKGPIANALDDVAVAAWIDGETNLARAASDMARTLRDADAPETLPWVPRFLGYQIASLIRAMGGPDAVRQAAAQVRGDDHDHDHEHKGSSGAEIG